MSKSIGNQFGSHCCHKTFIAIPDARCSVFPCKANTCQHHACLSASDYKQNRQIRLKVHKMPVGSCWFFCPGSINLFSFCLQRENTNYTCRKHPAFSIWSRTVNVRSRGCSTFVFLHTPFTEPMTHCVELLGRPTHCGTFHNTGFLLSGANAVAGKNSSTIHHYFGPKSVLVKAPRFLADRHLRSPHLCLLHLYVFGHVHTFHKLL